jgi:hypothetical protein
MKQKHYDIKILSDNDSPDGVGTKGEFYFEDLDVFSQETIIDLLASIIEGKHNPRKEPV